MSELWGVTLRDKTPKLYINRLAKIKNSIGIAIESESDVRRWTYDYLVELTKLVQAEWHVFGLKFIKLPKAIHNHLGEFSLLQTMTEVSKMERFVTVDSFFSHLVAALNIPSVVMYTSINAAWRATYYQNIQTIQSPKPCSPCKDKQEIRGVCDRGCIKSFTPELIRSYLCK